MNLNLSGGDGRGERRQVVLGRREQHPPVAGAQAEAGRPEKARRIDQVGDTDTWNILLGVFTRQIIFVSHNTF
jgi:hypothetical protein